MIHSLVWDTGLHYLLLMCVPLGISVCITLAIEMASFIYALTYYTFISKFNSQMQVLFSHFHICFTVTCKQRNTFEFGSPWGLQCYKG